MTAASPVPVHPRLGVRLAYRLQRLLRPNAGYRWLATRIEGQGLEGLTTGRHRDHVIALEAEGAIDGAPNRVIIVHYQDAHENGSLLWTHRKTGVPPASNLYLAPTFPEGSGGAIPG